MAQWKSTRNDCEFNSHFVTVSILCMQNLNIFFILVLVFVVIAATAIYTVQKYQVSNYHGS